MLLDKFARLLPYLVLLDISIPPLYAGKSQIKIGGKCLDVPNANMVNGAKLQLWDCNNTKAQEFEIVDSIVVTPPPTESKKCDGVPAWAAGKQYNVGERVVYKNQIFTVANANPGYDPVISHWFWTAGEKCDAVVVTPPPTTEPPPVVNPPPADNGDKEIAVYFQSWSAPWASSGADHSLAKLPPYVTTVLLAFVRPEASYTAGSALYSAGLDFSSDVSVIREAVGIARKQGKKILLSSGGATYYNWASYNVDGNIALMNYLGADGLDLDYEDMQQVCGWSTGGTGCPKDGEFIDIIKKTKAKMPAGKLLTTAAWSTGAYGEGQYHSTKMDGRQIGSNFGMYRNPLKEVGNLFDRIYIMAYDAGNKSTTGYDFRTAYEAYRSLYKGRLVIGVESCPEAWGGNCSDAADAKARAALSSGVMLWSWQKPGGIALAQAACQQLGMQGCSQGFEPSVAEADQVKHAGREFHTRPDHKK